MLGGEDLATDFLRDVCLTAVCAHFCWDGLEDPCRGFAFERDGSAAGAGLPTFTDDSLHVLLLLKSASQSSGSGSLTVITTSSCSLKLCATTTCPASPQG